MNDINKIITDYKYGFKSDVEDVYTTGKGLNEDVIRSISKYKKEPDWMLEFRLNAYRKFMEMPMPSFGPNLDFIDFNDYTYYRKATENIGTTWDEVPEKLRKLLRKLAFRKQKENS